MYDINAWIPSFIIVVIAICIAIYDEYITYTKPAINRLLDYIVDSYTV